MEEAEFTNDFEVYEYDNYTLGCACDWPGRDICTCDSVPTCMYFLRFFASHLVCLPLF